MDNIFIESSADTKNTAKVLLLDVSPLDDSDYLRFYDSASDERRRRAERYLRYGDAVRCIMSEALLRYAYFLSGKNPSLLRTACSPYGKPYTVSEESFRFSISHSGKYTAVAFADDEIGVDIEQIDRRLDRTLIADTVFTSDERAYIFSPSDEALRRIRFARLWTAKESCLKYLGTGLNRSPLTVEFDTAANRIVGSDAVLTGMQTADGYYVTVCGTYSDCKVEFTEISELKRILN